MRASRVDRSLLTPEQLEVVLQIEDELKQIFKKYDKNRDGCVPLLKRKKQKSYEFRKACMHAVRELRHWRKGVHEDNSENKNTHEYKNKYAPKHMSASAIN